MNHNIKAGADIHSGDGGYTIGTKEGYEAAVKERNRSALEKCDDILKALVGEKHVRIWWGTVNKEFDYVTPAEVFVDDPNRVLSYLMRFGDNMI